MSGSHTSQTQSAFAAFDRFCTDASTTVRICHISTALEAVTLFFVPVIKMER